MMNTPQRFQTCLLLCGLALGLQPPRGLAQSNPDTPGADLQKARARDGQHDFDFEIGTWKTHLRRLAHPLTGSTTWAEYDGTTVVRKIWEVAPIWWSSSSMARRVTSKA